MGFFLLMPVQNFLKCRYLGLVESEINKLTYDEATPNFFFDYFNLNPIENLENSKKTMNEDNPFKFNVESDSKAIDVLLAERNLLVSGQIFLKAL
jgi:hypothetical protein